MNKKRSRLINRWWERWAVTPDNDIFASSVSSAKEVKKEVKDVIRWYNKYKKLDKSGEQNGQRIFNG